MNHLLHFFRSNTSSYPPRGADEKITENISYGEGKWTNLAWRGIEWYIPEVSESRSAPWLSESEGKCQHPLIASATRAMPKPFLFYSWPGWYQLPAEDPELHRVGAISGSIERPNINWNAHEETSTLTSMSVSVPCCFFGKWSFSVYQGTLSNPVSCNQLLQVLLVTTWSMPGPGTEIQNVCTQFTKRGSDIAAEDRHIYFWKTAKFQLGPKWCFL